MRRYLIIARGASSWKMRDGDGGFVCVRGKIAGRELGVVEALNAADAAAEARRRWPDVRLGDLSVREEHEVDRA